ncbi:MAG: spore germination protein [Thermoanaerobacterales bacterium]|nr:spore germination protein [Bacillota bacterium]MDI6906457.1 spore germination protein [Thermoanaerobacterales bacterium]
MSEGKRRRFVRRLSEMLRRMGQAAGGRRAPQATGGVKDFCDLKELEKVPLTVSLDENLAMLRRVLGDSPGFNVRELLVAGERRAALLFIEGLVNRQLVTVGILRPLMGMDRKSYPSSGSGRLLDAVRATAVAVAPTRECRSAGQVVRDVLDSAAVVLLDGEPRALTVEVTGFPTRSIEEPVSETAVRGPRDGFTESLAQNLTMIQRRLKTPNLAVENHFLGRETHTQVAVLYLKGRADPKRVAELRRRLERIGDHVDAVLESSYIEEMIADQPLSPFPQAMNTERPDRVAAALLEGRIAILVENTPFALVVPFEFMALMQSAEDYYQNYWFGSAIRVLRYISLAIALVGPAIYVAITTFHQEMIPERLLVQVVAARQGIPFPAVIEMLLIDYAFEILREAGIRLPRPVGQAVSIVGALVIGQAAIQAGLTSPLAVIIVALTGIASFAVPAFSLAFAIRFIRFPLTILGGVFGLYGVIIGVLAVIIHLAGLRTLGVPYLAGFTPLHVSDLKDSAVRFPWWAMRRRPHELSKDDPRRQGPGLKPGPEA